MSHIERSEMFKQIENANGLLLLSTGIAPIPSKIFEYIKSAKPILAVTIKDSSVWQLGDKLPQMFLYDYSAKELDYLPIKKFLSVCKTGNYDYKIPEEFSEEYLSKIFLNTVKQI